MPTTARKQQLNIRDVPEHFVQWLKSESDRRAMKQNEFLLMVLDRAARGEIAPTLFDSLPPREPPTPGPAAFPFTFIDLFAGIGGFRQGLERVGGRCRFSCEWDKHSQRTYHEWFGEKPFGDIRAITKPGEEIPDHHILAAGFPCQPFSIAGVSKKNALGKAHGFRCDTQGTLFFNIATIIEAKRPPVVILENVKNLLSHDKGKTWKVIHSALTELRYKVFHKIIDAAAYVPQHRERVFIVGFDTDVFGENPPFEFPRAPERPRPKLRDILEPNPPARYTLTDHLWNYLQNYARRHAAKGNGFGFGLADLDGVTRTLSARYFKDGSEILIPQPGRNPRRLTPRECARLMGYDEKYPIVVSDTQAYRQFGNSLCPLIVEDVAREVIKVFCWKMQGHANGKAHRCLLSGATSSHSAGRKHVATR